MNKRRSYQVELLEHDNSFLRNEVESQSQAIKAIKEKIPAVMYAGLESMSLMMKAVPASHRIVSALAGLYFLAIKEAIGVDLLEDISSDFESLLEKLGFDQVTMCGIKEFTQLFQATMKMCKENKSDDEIINFIKKFVQPNL
ncbi:MAG: hypothetical protein A2Y12_05525 [Planctomycetes bacterium GWF2_42_9]|nr:MAG: hypothetical protein A2Y12_05525 [Planctomycetes bacterium GWF2_42_9]